VNRYLTGAEIVEINSEMVRQFGGIHGLRDSRALESAVVRPRSGYYADVIEEAAALFESPSQPPVSRREQTNCYNCDRRLPAAKWL
jgi:death-on-curing protein